MKDWSLSLRSFFRNFIPNPKQVEFQVPSEIHQVLLLHKNLTNKRVVIESMKLPESSEVFFGKQILLAVPRKTFENFEDSGTSIRARHGQFERWNRWVTQTAKWSFWASMWKWVRKVLRNGIKLQENSNFENLEKKRIEKRWKSMRVEQPLAESSRIY